jgi:putative oxidoreductase
MRLSYLKRKHYLKMCLQLPIFEYNQLTTTSVKITVLISRILLGFLYLVFGLDYFFRFIPVQPVHTGVTGAFIAGLKGIGYFYPMMKVIQIVCGLSLMFNRYAPFSAVVLFPISLNVLLFHTILVPSGWLMGVFLFVPNVLLGIGWWKYYKGMFTAKAVVE